MFVKMTDDAAGALGNLEQALSVGKGFLCLPSGTHSLLDFPLGRGGVCLDVY